MKHVKALFLLTLLLTTTAMGKTASFNQKRSITISGIVDERLMREANNLLDFAEVSDEPIDILIASPGGSVSSGLYFIRAMRLVQDKGVAIRCFVPQMAASMAYVIFTQCNERYALGFAGLLFHAPRIQGTFLITPPIATFLASQLKRIETALVQLILPVMGVTPENGGEWFMQSYGDERMFTALELLEESPAKWLTIVDRIEGCKELYPQLYPGQPGGQRNTAEFVYIKR